MATVKEAIVGLGPGKDFVENLTNLYALQRLLVEGPESLKDEFRDNCGFERVIELICTCHPNSTSIEEACELLKLCLSIIGSSLLFCFENSRYLDSHVGWSVIESTLLSTDLATVALPQLLGILLAFTINQYSVASFYVSCLRHIEPTSSEDTSAMIQDLVFKHISNESVFQPTLIPLLFDLSHSASSSDSILEITLQCLIQLTISSPKNVIQIESTRLVSSALSRFIDGQESNFAPLYRSLILALGQLGLNDFTASIKLVRAAYSSPVCSRLLLDLIKSSSQPKSLYFDTWDKGYSSLTLHSLDTSPFQAKGYSLCYWVNFHSFDNAVDLPLQTIYNAKGTPVISVSLGSQSHCIHFSVCTPDLSSPLASTTFKSYVFDVNIWYHIVIVHKRKRLSSKLSLYVNGILVDSVRCAYPVVNASCLPLSVVYGVGKLDDAELFRSVLRLKWSVASAFVIENALSSELAFVQYQLGPRYGGNFQDVLGLYLTYKASASLNLRNDEAYAGKDDTSNELISVVKNRGSSFFSESSIWSNLNSTVYWYSVLATPDSPDIPGTLYSRYSRFYNLFEVVPKSTSTHWTASGSVFPSMCRPLDETLWSLGGLDLAIIMAEDSTTPEELQLSLSIMFESLRHNWRNSEEMEKSKGFSLLSHVLSKKAQEGLINLDILQTILQFIGYNFYNEKESIIWNPLAYRVLLLKYDLWKYAEPDVLSLYFKQFVTFNDTSNFRHYNIQRLKGMRIIRCLLQFLKTDSLSKSSLLLFIRPFRSFLMTCMNADTMRAVSMFIVYSFRKEELTKDKASATAGIPTISINDNSESLLCPSEIALNLLGVFVDILCDKSATKILKKFAKTISTKWSLYLLTESNSQVVIQGLKLISRLLMTHGRTYYLNFSNKSRGFSVMRHALPQWAFDSVVWSMCLFILFGINIDFPDYMATDVSYVTDQLLARKSLSPVYPEMIPVIFAMFDSGISQLSEAKADEQDYGAKLALLSSFVSLIRKLRRKHSYIKSAFYADEVQRQILSTLYIALFHGMEDFEFASTVIEFYPNVETDFFGYVSHLNHEIPFIEKSPEYPLHDTLRLKRNPALRSDHFCSVIDEYARLWVDIMCDNALSSNDMIGYDLSLYLPEGNTHHIQFLRICLHRLLLLEIPKRIRSFSTASGLKYASNSTALLNRISAYRDDARYDEGYSDFFRYCEILVSLRDSTVNKESHRSKFPKSSSELLDSCLQLSILSFLNDSDYLYKDQMEPCIELVSDLISAIDLKSSKTTFSKCLVLLISERILHSEPELKGLFLKLWKLVCISRKKEFSALFLSTEIPINWDVLSLNALRDDILFTWAEENAKMLYSFALTHFAESTSFFVSELSFKLSEDTKGVINRRENRLVELLEDKKVFDNICKEFFTGLRTWKQSIYMSEHVKYLRNIQDVEDDRKYFSRQLEQTVEHLELQSPVVISPSESPHWGLDLTEGPDKMRKKMRRVKESLVDTLAHAAANLAIKPKEISRRLSSESHNRSRSGSTALDRPASPMPDKTTRNFVDSNEMEVVVDEDISENDIDSDFEIIDDSEIESFESTFEDRNRRIIRNLAYADAVSYVWNVNRVVGLQNSPALLILGKVNIYLIDNYFQRSDGEIIEAKDTPTNEKDSFSLLTYDSKTSWLNPINAESHEVHRWSLDELVSVTKRSCLFLDIALEVCFLHGRSAIVACVSPKERDSIYNLLVPHVNFSLSSELTGVTGDAFNSMIHGSQMASSSWAGSLGSKLSSAFANGGEPAITKEWTAGRVSNFHYLVALNTIAGRTFNDLTQYPVFPWVIADYYSSVLDLNNPLSFRDLSKPMGAQTPERAQMFKERYDAFADLEDSSDPPFHYGTHYSSSMIVSSYLIRLEPFVRSYLILQGGQFDHADRLFYSISKAWESASKDTTSDVRELVPEFFFLPEFLLNLEGFQLGRRQSKEKIDSVELPTWAKDDPFVFITKHREALESQYVTEHLHEWIDLIFGYKQKGTAAVNALNVFHHLSYAGSVNLTDISDPVQKQATASIIHNFGQTPAKIFSKPHPAYQGPTTSHSAIISLNCMRMATTGKLIQSHEDRVNEIFVNKKSGKIAVHRGNIYCMDRTYERFVTYGYSDSSIRILNVDHTKTIGLVEQCHLNGPCLVKVGDSRTILSSGDDLVLIVWKASSPSKSGLVDIRTHGILRGHGSPIKHFDVSIAWNLAISCDESGRVLMWDLVRLKLTRELYSESKEKPYKVQIDARTGNIFAFCDTDIIVWNINGTQLFCKNILRSSETKRITAIASYDSADHEYLNQSVFVTGHKNGELNIISFALSEEENRDEKNSNLWCINNYKTLVCAGRTAISSIHIGYQAQAIYAGTEKGEVYEWTTKEAEK
ncbi:hypothetical protein CANCADRAFT_99255 [Tortispora caseinolytica NRRL Y-17796]|uniref:Beige protein homolog 1 n=1 Tax=Tortispora caseinolytica NRRL Y-17796 TaxID=767744 RepID=A0A1E4TE63_9ASCO|nr:hypothetical protein CANCADRAFT_99255 [Tortispora caseinolytica NRRL Y-17796]